LTSGHRGAQAGARTPFPPSPALSLGVTLVDTGITKDNVVVIAHDRAESDIARQKTAWSSGAVLRSTLRLPTQQYTWTSKPGTQYKRYTASRWTAHVSSLADLCRSANRATRGLFQHRNKRSPGARRDAGSGTFGETLGGHSTGGMAARVTIQSFDWRTLQAVQRIVPEMPTAYLTAQQKFLDNIAADKSAGSPWTAGFQYRHHGSVPKMIKAARGKIWSPYYGDLSEGALREARALGLRVIVWTVNEPADGENARPWGGWRHRR
jgi:glycerophosphoryl diester phosphodiesterase